MRFIKNRIMKKLAFLSILLLIISTVYAQTNKEIPASFKYKLKKEVPEIFVPFSEKGIRSLDSVGNLAKKGVRVNHPRNGLEEIYMSIDFMKESSCEKLPNRNKVRRLKIKSNACISNIVFKNLVIPKDANLYWHYEGDSILWEITEKQRKQIFFQIQPLNKPIIFEYLKSRKSKSKEKIIISMVDLFYFASHMQTYKVGDFVDVESWHPNIRCDWVNSITEDFSFHKLLAK